jgi:RNA-dependent RNA polymerase
MSLDGRHNFSDGVGTISLDLATEIYRSHALSTGNVRDAPDEAVVPSAFQVRFGGFKGVLSVDARLDGSQLRARPSMHKFDVPTASTVRIEVCSVAKRLPAFLNRQLITLLSTLGVADEVFDELQARQMRALDDALSDDAAAAALLAAAGASVFGPAVAHDLRAMLAAGLSVTSDPFLTAMLRALRAALLRDLCDRARILVPDAACLMGIMDESGALRDGELYAQTRGEAPLNGLVIVTRSPCLHP